MTENNAGVSESLDSRASAARAPIISTTTRVSAVVMALTLIVLGTLDQLAWAGSLGAAKDVPAALLTLVPLAVAALIILVARSFGRGVVRAQWMLFGLGLLSVGVGNVIFLVLYLVTGTDPYPSIADLFTLAGYACFAAGLFMAIRAYRGLLDIRRPLLIGAVIATVTMAISYFVVIGPYVIFATGQTQSIALRVFNTLYLVLDAYVLLMPTVTLGLLVSKLGTGRVAWPWWFVVVGATILAVTDTVFAYAGYLGAGRTPLIDAGYALAPLLLGLATLVARDIYDS